MRFFLFLFCSCLFCRFNVIKKSDLLSWNMIVMRITCLLGFSNFFSCAFHLRNENASFHFVASLFFREKDKSHQREREGESEQWHLNDARFYSSLHHSIDRVLLTTLVCFLKSEAAYASDKMNNFSVCPSVDFLQWNPVQTFHGNNFSYSLALTLSSFPFHIFPTGQFDHFVWHLLHTYTTVMIHLMMLFLYGIFHSLPRSQRSVNRKEKCLKNTCSVHTRKRFHLVWCIRICFLNALFTRIFSFFFRLTLSPHSLSIVTLFCFLFWFLHSFRTLFFTERIISDFNYIFPFSVFFLCAKFPLRQFKCSWEIS